MSPRARALLPTLTVAVLLASAGWAGGRAAAQPLPSLRAELDAVRRDGARVPEGTLLTIGHLLDVAGRIEADFPAQAAEWRARAGRYLEAVRAGRDPLPEQRGKIVTRAYRSPVSTEPQGYAIYLPPDYDPSRAYPLYVALHGGSSNGNLFLGVVLGNNMDWLTYDQHLYDEYTPLWSPDWIVVAPTGFGQIMWRWMGERDVLDVIADVERHYRVDPDHVVLGGLSNGGVGAYAIGARHAWRFSTVQAMAGAPSWLQYVGGSLPEVERRTVLPWSGLHLIENTAGTDFRYYHGRRDGGPMRPAYVEELGAQLARLGLPRKETWFDLGHDILYPVHRRGRVYRDLAEVRRDRRPREVRVVTGDYRANRQHWVTVTRIARYPDLARVRAVADGGVLEAETDNVDALQLDLRDAPVAGERLRLVIDGEVVHDGARAPLGQRVHLRRHGGRWALGAPEDPDGLVKKPGLSGPLTDAYYERMVHVYGTANEAHTATLRRAAERGARGWPLWSWSLRQEVIADRDVTDALLREAHVVVYGSPGDNLVLERMTERLPIRVEPGAVVVGADRYTGAGTGVRFIYPNPLAPERYVIVQAGVTPEAAAAGNGLHEFLPDFVVYDRATVRAPQGRVLGRRRRALALGYFDGRWRLPAPAGGGGPGAGSGPEDAPPGVGPSGGPEDAPPALGPSAPSPLPIPPAPPVPGLPARYGAPPSDPAGRAARRIARRVLELPNFRAEIPGAVWTVDPRAAWTVRPEARCLAALAAAGIPARPLPEHPTPVPTPVEILGPIEGVFFRAVHEEEPVVVSCELALRMRALARVLRRHGVTGVEVLSSYRDAPRTSFHTMGLALDLSRFWTDRGWLSVAEDFEATPDTTTCEAPRPSTSGARTLLRVACALARSRAFSTVLTPNYNAGHRDHFHLDARPYDDRLYLR